MIADTVLKIPQILVYLIMISAVLRLVPLKNLPGISMELSGCSTNRSKLFRIRLRRFNFLAWPLGRIWRSRGADCGGSRGRGGPIRALAESTGQTVGLGALEGPPEGD